MSVILSIIGIGLLASSIAIAANADLRVPPSAPPEHCKVYSIALESNLLSRTFEAVDKKRDCWVQAICSAVSNFTQAQYDQFVKLVREESVEVNNSARANRSLKARHFHMYVLEDPVRAYQCLEQRGDGSKPDVQLDLYWIIETSQMRTRAYKWLKKAVEGGSPLAQYRMSEETLLFGPNNSKTPPEVADYANAASYYELLRKAAEADIPAAQVMLARYYLGSRLGSWGKIPIDAKSAIVWYQRAAAQITDDESHYNAMAELGHLYFRGTQVPQNYAEAYKWYSQLDPARLAGCGQLAIVLINRKRMYREGLGVPQDSEKANQLEKYPTACP